MSTAAPVSQCTGGAGYQKYASYDVKVVPEEDDKASELKLLSFGRPHMRAFHFAVRARYMPLTTKSFLLLQWFTFFIAFSAWFALAPLTPVVVKSLERDLDEQYTCSDQACPRPYLVCKISDEALLLLKVCTRSDGNGTFVGCILTGTMTDTVLVAPNPEHAHRVCFISCPPSCH